MGAHPARNDRLDCIDHAPSAGKLTPADGAWGQRPYTKNKKQAIGLRICFKSSKNGAVDGTRTRDPRRDRPVL